MMTDDRVIITTMYHWGCYINRCNIYYNITTKGGNGVECYRINICIYY